MERVDPVNAQLRQLPAVDSLVEGAGAGTGLARWSLLAAARVVLHDARDALVSGSSDGGIAEDLPDRVRTLARTLERPAPGRVVNATGVVLHTNLGRAPLAPASVEAMAEAVCGYSDLEFDIERGGRGSRLTQVSELLCLLSGAEAATVVNNNAGAVLLALDAIAADREVVLSRGELVEIGGSFRVPEILESSRARLVEIGTTNRTHLEDYAQAIGPDTGALLKVHRSNFEVRGFTSEVTIPELAPLARERGLPLIEDRGSGTFVNLTPHGIPETEVQRGLRDGADLVLFSGDKLLGGPQAGIAIGGRDLIGAMQSSPLARALRVDKMTLAVLHWTLRRLLDGSAPQQLPVLAMLLADPDQLRQRAERLAAALRPRISGVVSVEPHGSLVGGGALPDLELSGWAVRVETSRSPDSLGRALRQGDPPVLVRIHRDAVMLDPRTLFDSELDRVVEAFVALRI